MINNFKDVELVFTKIRMLLTDLVYYNQVYIDENKKQKEELYADPFKEGIRKRKKITTFNNKDDK